jgi:beta-phosphoglucomutase family hydrolase
VGDDTRVAVSPDRFEAVVFDMDGVITDTARVHRAAWRRLFDEYLTESAPESADRRPFSDDDYRRHVDGRSRIDGIHTFLTSRGIELPRGSPDDPPGHDTEWALAGRKNRYFLATLAAEGARPFRSSLRLARELRAAGVRTAVVTASRNRAEVLGSVDAVDLFDAHVDGIDAAELGLHGKPDPAVFLEAARRLGVDPARAVVIEDALSGVEAGRRGGFGLVVGVDRTGDHGADFIAHGADVVVADLDVLVVAAEEDP